MTKKTNSKSGLRWLWVALVVFVLDRISKDLAVTHLAAYQPYRITSYFNLTLAYNKGAAFSFLGHASGWQTWLFGILAVTVSLAILKRMKQITSEQRWLSIAFALIIGGAIGNLADRIIYGRVIDFIQWHIAQYAWPVFNVADSAICVGAVMLVLDAIFGRKNVK